MSKTRKRYGADFKAKVALEAMAELASRHGIHPTMIATWKRQAIDGMAATVHRGEITLSGRINGLDSRP